MSLWDHLRRLAQALTPPMPLSARAEAQRKLEALWREVARHNDIVHAASDAAIAAAPAEMPHVRDRDMGVGLGLERCHCCFVFETDADLAFAKERGLTDWLDRTSREQLVFNGCPKHIADKFHVSFTTHEDVVRKTGGDYRMYFS